MNEKSSEYSVSVHSLENMLKNEPTVFIRISEDCTHAPHSTPLTFSSLLFCVYLLLDLFKGWCHTPKTTENTETSLFLWKAIHVNTVESLHRVEIKIFWSRFLFCFLFGLYKRIYLRLTFNVISVINQFIGFLPRWNYTNIFSSILQDIWQTNSVYN